MTVSDTATAKCRAAPGLSDFGVRVISGTTRYQDRPDVKRSSDENQPLRCRERDVPWSRNYAVSQLSRLTRSMGPAVGDFREVSLDDVRKAFRGRHEIFEAIAFWVRERGWRVREQAHKYGLYPPDPGFRMIPPFVRIDGTAAGDAKRQARMLNRNCEQLQAAIEARKSDLEG